jgi:Glycosyltransferase family 87
MKHFKVESKKSEDFKRRRWLRHGLLNLIFALITAISGCWLIFHETAENNVWLTNPKTSTINHSEIVVNRGVIVPGKIDARRIRSADAVSTSLSFQYRMPGANAKTGSPFLSIGSISKDGGILSLVNSRGEFTVTTGTSNASRWGQAAYGGYYSNAGWHTISVNVVRNRSISIYVDHQLINAFSWNGNFLRPGSKDLEFVAENGAMVRNVSLSVTTWTNLKGTSLLIKRLGQAAGILLLSSGIAILSNLLFRRVIPRSVINRDLVKLAFGVIGVGTLINVFIGVMRFQPPSFQYSRNTWLFWSEPRFSDLFQILEISRSLQPYGNFNGSYPPFGYFAIYPLSQLNEYVSLFIFLCLFVGFFTWWVSRSFAMGFSFAPKIAIVLTGLFCLPVSFGIDRANLDLIIFVIVALGIALLEKSKRLSAASLLAIAGAMKLYPGLYLLRYVKRGEIKYLASGIISILILTLGSLMFFDGGIRSNIHLWLLSVQMNIASAKPNPGNAWYNSSLVGWCQAVAIATSGVKSGLRIESLATHFAGLLEISLTLALIWYLRYREFSSWRSTALITLLFLGVLNPSFYYEEIFLLIPLSLFVKQALSNSRTIFISVIFGLLLMPKSYLYVNGMTETGELLTFPLILLLCLAILWDGISERRLSSRAHGKHLKLVNA